MLDLLLDGLGRLKVADSAIQHLLAGMASEYKRLHNLAQRLLTDAEGTIRIFTEQRPCISCTSVVKQFQARFPRIKVIVNHGEMAQ